MKNNYQKLVMVLGSRISFVAIMVLAALQSVWVAVSSRYPMAFDEAYHYSLTRLHAEQWNPLFLQQPDGPAPYGALVRDPSWLHHYILSFPYRILEAFGASEFTKVVALRLCNVAMFLVGLYLFRKLLLATKASRAAVHATLLFFVLIPTVITLAGQINYDNLQFPLLAGTLLATHLAAQSLRAKKPHALMILRALALAILGSLNKFTFLPFLLAVVVYLVVVYHRAYGKKFKKFQAGFMRSWQTVADWHRPVVLTIMALLTGLFIWFYGVNTIVYQNPVIQCHQVLEPSRCEGFEPWLRNYNLAKEAVPPSPNPLKFTVDWIGGMFYRTFFVINGATGPRRYVNHVPVGVAGVAIALLVVVVPLLARYARRIIKGDQMLQLSLVAAVVYIAALWGRNYNDYLHLGEMVAINGRYFQPVLPILIILAIACYQHAFRLMPGVKFAIFAVALVGFLSGGGVIGFIHYSDLHWYFEDKQWVVNANEFGKKVISPLFLFTR